jgi:hypothetical protein
MHIFLTYFFSQLGLQTIALFVWLIRHQANKQAAYVRSSSELPSAGLLGVSSAAAFIFTDKE